MKTTAEWIEQVMAGGTTVLRTETAARMDFLFDDVAIALHAEQRDYTFRDVSPTEIHVTTNMTYSEKRELEQENYWRLKEEGLKGKELTEALKKLNGGNN